MLEILIDQLQQPLSPEARVVAGVHDCVLLRPNLQPLELNMIEDPIFPHGIVPAFADCRDDRFDGILYLDGIRTLDHTPFSTAEAERRCWS
jgi:hypothetical protein